MCSRCLKNLKSLKSNDIVRLIQARDHNILHYVLRQIIQANYKGNVEKNTQLAARAGLQQAILQLSGPIEKIVNRLPLQVWVA